MKNDLFLVIRVKPYSYKRGYPKIKSNFKFSMTGTFCKGIINDSEILRSKSTWPLTINWFPSAEYETTNTIRNVGLFDLTPFSKLEIKSEKAHEELQRICTANIKNEVGKCTYTHMLNIDGGIETDLTVACLDKDNFFLSFP